MHTEDMSRWRHQHVYGQEHVGVGERRSRIVLGLTAVTMVVEVVCGLLFGSMALLADGVHMASHTVALGITVFAYVYARRRSRDERFSFGTGRTNALAGFTGAVLLGVFALLMAWESVLRFLNPVEISFDPALLVAGVGLVVNAASVLILGGHHEGTNVSDDDLHHHEDHHHHHDHNLRSAYLHVMADALTSLTAIFALLAGKYMDLAWMDPAMGVVGALLIANWSRGLLRDTSRVLLDHQAPAATVEDIRSAIQSDTDDRVADLHVWAIGPGAFAAEMTVVTHEPQPPDHYKTLIPKSARVVHATVEVHACAGRAGADAA